LRKELSQNAFEYSRRFSWDTTTRELAEFLAVS